MGTNWWYLKPCRGEMIQRQPTNWADVHATHLYLGTKNTAQSLLRDVAQCCREVPLPSKALWTDEMCCTVASL